MSILDWLAVLIVFGILLLIVAIIYYELKDILSSHQHKDNPNDNPDPNTK
jgi:hypothetical protein